MIVLIAAIGAAVYGYHVWRHPYYPCPRCGGRGMKADPVRNRAYGNCWKCGGRGEFPRMAVRIFMPGTAKKIASRQHGRNF